MSAPFGIAAARLAGLDIAVFPLSPREKIPPKDFKWRDEASADAARVARWWRGSPWANVAVATGAPAGFWVLDIDGADGAASLAALEAEHGPLPDTVEQSTGKGRHLCFAWDASAPEIRNSAGKLGTGVDVRGAGGYIVAAPSIHPSGRTYEWRAGHAPWDRPFAVAPEWLTRLVTPAPVEAKPLSTAKPVLRQDGRASPYGEAALTRACADVSGAPAGQQDLTLFWRAYSIGRLIGGGEIEAAYGREALEAAGLRMTPSGKAWTLAEVADKVARGLERGQSNPKVAPERRSPQAATPRRAEGFASPAKAAAAAQDVRGLWVEAQSADVGLVRAWLKLRQLPHDTAWARAVLARLRAHPSAPLNGAGDRGPALLAPMTRGDAETPPEALGVLPLLGGAGNRGADRFAWFVGDPSGRAIWLAPPEDGQLVVALDLADAWALGSAADESDDAMGVALTPTVSAFCGGALGDRFGRVDVETPQADPASPPWMSPGLDMVYLAVRGDLRLPELKTRRVGGVTKRPDAEGVWRDAPGGTRRVAMSGEAAARLCGSLAEQAWRRPLDQGGGGANRVRLLRPTLGAGFYQSSGRVA